jgi:hypothetical protein
MCHALILTDTHAFVFFTTAPAAADPVANPHKSVFPVTCAGQTYLVIAGPGAAAQVINGTEILVAAAFVQVSSWTDPATSQVVTQTDVFSVGKGKHTGQQGAQITCTYTVFADPEIGPVTVNGTVMGVLTSGH